jgi:putative transposase
MLTIYSPKVGECYKIGDEDISKIFRLCKHLDKLIGKKRVKKKKRAIIVLRKRIRDLVTEVHCKAIVFLLNTFDHIIIPPFNVGQMVRRQNRKLSKSSVRKMLSWRHYDFKMRLKEKALQCGVQVYERGEEYTSKTCTHCMLIKPDLGGAKVYKCDHCHLKADRDVCGARNIFIKNASEYGR